MTLACIGVMTSSVSATDRILSPPAREVFISPAAGYEFVITMNGLPKGWVKSGSQGMLAQKAKGSNILWKRSLPHSYRPRFALVSDQGTVILFDQWINVLGPYAISVLDSSGGVAAEYSFDDIASAVEVSRADIVSMAQHGSWMSAWPKWDTTDRLATVRVGGKILLIHLDDGTLEVK